MPFLINKMRMFNLPHKVKALLELFCL